jgi:crotonobetainyl-CoA:carnitine CoA-transferase CaiB-like acyl-CoA transferase
MVLADLGADVVKVERIGRGEDGRAMGPHRGVWGAYFVTLNRGKRSIAINIKKPQGREVVLRLASRCDVFLESFRGGKAAALGLDETSVRARKPDIIYASLSAYGPRGPDYTKPGYDAVLQARTGVMSVTGDGDSTPIRAGVSILDMGAGVWLALGVLAALMERQRTGKGQRVDTSLFQTGVMLMSYHLLYRQFSGVNPVPQGSRHTAFAPYGAYPTKDGSIMIGISSDRAFHRLCTVLGKPEWIDDLRYLTNADRVRHAEELARRMAEVLMIHPTAHWVELFDQNDIANDAVQNPEQVLGDSQAAALSQFARVALPGETAALVPRLPLEFSAVPPSPLGSPPAPGEHGRAILSEAGYNDAEVDELLRCEACAFAQ